MKIQVKCNQCKNDFLKQKSEIKRQLKLGIKNNFCSNLCSRLFNKNNLSNILPTKRRQSYYNNPKKCINCNNIISYEKRINKFCSRKCGAIYTQKYEGHCKWDEIGKENLSNIVKKLWKNGHYNNLISRIEKQCEICHKSFFGYENTPNKNCCSRKCKNEWIVKTGFLKGKSGGYRRRGGRGKQGWYKGYYCNSSWELAWVIYQLEHNSQFKRNTIGFEYEFNNKKLKFYPDFILDNGEYVEVNGYVDDKVKAKFKYFPHKLIVVGREDIKPYIKYVTDKYGADFIKLYEDKK
jgi:hypothetical protein